ncbi:MAG: DUF1292 domain-containing protein [Bacilli bacterium]|nr:DUF1292 domain-containing protein [Bacilli bacterium]
MEKIKIQNMNGLMEEVDLVKSFGISELNKDFVILSKGETSEDGNLSKIYISEVTEETPGVFKLIGITDENIWNEVKSALKEMASGGNKQ